MPALLYIKHDGYIEPQDVKRLADEKLISGIKYATVRDGHGQRRLPPPARRRSSTGG